MRKKYVYFFGGGKAEGNAQMKDLLGGKGANLAEMTNAHLPVPPGFTITTEVCNIFYKDKMRLPGEIDAQIKLNLKKLESAMGAKLGDPAHPLLISVRSGAKFSMPGMMDTILNLGLNDETLTGLIELTKNGRFALDAYRRFIQMFSNVVLGIEKSIFEEMISERKKKSNRKLDVELTAGDLKELISRFKARVKSEVGRDFPRDVFRQLEMARDAVFKSWNNERARFYRKQYHIPDTIGTAVNVQAMVFGNMGEDSGTGVGFTRDPSTGETVFFGEYLTNAQGEDVVAGIRTPHPIADLKKQMPVVFDELYKITKRLERHYRDVQDFEFTIQSGKLYMLQTRNGKRTGPAAVKIAVDMVHEKLLTKEEALMRVEPEQLDQLLHPMLPPKGKFNVLARGLNASPGAATGKAVFEANEAAELGKKGERVLLVRNETCPDDIHGIAASQGILTATGGATSHAVVVSRQMGKPCVAGCSALKIDEEKGLFRVGDIVVKKGDYITIDGSSGQVILGEVDTIQPNLKELIKGPFGELMKWADEVRRLKVRANADIPADAIAARENGAEGIGLCRTEHMFFAKERLPIMQEMILAHDERTRKDALNKLLPMQREDFKGLFRVMKGFPVTIRLLDPPLHEFLPKREELLVELTTMRLDPQSNKLELGKKEALLRRVEELHEFNPMLGLRGCRLGIAMPEITEMQATAIFEAACELAKEGQGIIPEVMIPLVGHIQEFENQKAIVNRVAQSVAARYNVKLKYLVGTMIEIPRAAITANEIARSAEFFSFGTNDLTQMTFGFSRDDAGKYLPIYIKLGILERDPFVTIDQVGVGRLIELATKEGRSVRPKLKVGICGEHGGEPASVEFCHRVGLDYVSASPYRVPIARLAAAQAALREKKPETSNQSPVAGRLSSVFTGDR